MAAREGIDFFIVRDDHLAIHARLTNWSRYVAPRHSHFVGPIWKLGRSTARQWDVPTLHVPIDNIDGHKIEKAVGLLPVKHRDALRWAYCRRTILPHKMRRELGVTEAGLMELIHQGRTMLCNRTV
jgi:hypothetical protein